MCIRDSCWNYHIDKNDSEKATVTYNMNILQSVKSESDFLVTLNCPEKIDPELILKQITYHHPIFSAGRRSFQKRHHELIGANRTSFCGAYWGNGFHEDGVSSALAVCDFLIEPRNQ